MFPVSIINQSKLSSLIAGTNLKCLIVIFFYIFPSSHEHIYIIRINNYLSLANKFMIKISVGFK